MNADTQGLRRAVIALLAEAGHAGPIGDTEGVRRLAPSDAARAAMAASIPLGRFGRTAEVADMALDPVSMRATRGGSELMLSPIGLRLLTILMRESPRVVTRQEIEREIWGNGLPDSDTLRSHLYNLRKVIDKPFDKPLLHTVQSAGYRIADIA